MGSQTLLNRYSEFGEEPALQCRRQSVRRTHRHRSLVRGLLRESWIRGSSDSRTISFLAGLLEYEDTRLKTSTRVRMGLSLAWKASLAINYEDSILCNPRFPRCLYKLEGVVRKGETHDHSHTG